jgi:hypothetical protein
MELCPKNNVERGPLPGGSKPSRSAFTRRRSAPSQPGGGDGRVSGTHADRHDDISHNGSSWFGDNTDSAETADLDRVLINAQIAAPLFPNCFYPIPVRQPS